MAEEDGGVCQAEAIDALLHVADHKAVFAIRNRLEDGFLHAVRILELVDHDFRKGAGDRLGDVRLFLRLLIQQEADGHVFQVAEIEHIIGFFLRLKTLVKVSDECEHTADGALRTLEVGEDFLRRPVDALELLIHCLLIARADILDLLLQGFGHFRSFADSLELCPTAVLGKKHGVPIRGQEFVQFRGVLVDGRAVCRGKRRITVADILRDVDERELGADIFLRRTDDICAPRRLCCVRVFRHIHIRKALCDPLRRPRMRLDGVVDRVDDGRHSRVVSAIGKLLDKSLLVRVLVDVPIQRFQRIFHCRGAQDLCFLLLCDTKVARETCFRAVRAKKCGAVGMDGGDFGVIDAEELVADVLVARTMGVCGGQALGKSGGDFGAQLSGSRLGVGDDEERVDILSLLADLLHNAVYEDLRLAGTSCC